MSPSAVSQQMAVLEREAGVDLLDRTGRGVQLTDAGRRLVQHTERVLAELERAEAELASARQGISGHVRVSAFPTAARAILVPALVQLQREHPNLQVSMIDLEPEEALPALKARELDIALVYEWDLLPSLEDPGIEREELLTETVYLALPKDHRLAPREGAVTVAELAEDQWIVGRDGTSMLDLVTAAAHRAGFEPRTQFHSMDFGVILAAVAAGLGVAFFIPLAWSAPVEGVVVKPLSDLGLNRSVWASIRRGSGGAPGTHAVLDALQAEARRVAEALPDSLAGGMRGAPA